PDIAEDAAAGAGRDRAGFVELVAEVRVGRGGEIFPFAFGRQARVDPAGESIGLEVTDVGDGRRPVDLAPSSEGEFGAVAAPVERRRNLLALNPVPAFRQPQGGGVVAASLDELAPFVVRDAPVRDFVRFKEDAVARALGVEGETRS